MERDPDLPRAYGEALGSLRVGWLSAAQVENLAPTFAISNAPCQVAARVEGNENLGRLVRQILNPLCSAEGWMLNVVALDGLTKQSIVQGNGVRVSDDNFAHLIMADDDESSPVADAASQGNGIDVDFNKLSQVLAAFRQRMAISFREVLAPVGKCCAPAGQCRFVLPRVAKSGHAVEWCGVRDPIELASNLDLPSASLDARSFGGGPRL